ncbi:uncharacterized protein LOC100375059 [Saccoglossus kowalevskii]|uniref:Uncharacterized protein LOC100375059 n=1 Tax=Saccoglossus kowalevskii TaxID=10224 RepID=A0ABM0GJN7_SACKO|nr:PREDICTED: uncharacterized protein LOC100375059 [Saccoglossus kowalevskii]
MIITLLFGLNMLIVISCGQDPGNPPDDSCVNCKDVFFDNGEWNGICTEEVSCADFPEDGEYIAAKQKEDLEISYYAGDVSFLPGTRTYAYVAIEASKVNSIVAEAIGKGIPQKTDNCQLCDVSFREDDWLITNCRVLPCPVVLADHIEFGPDAIEENKIRSRLCKNRKNGEINHFTCKYKPEVEGLVSDVIADS